MYIQHQQKTPQKVVQSILKANNKEREDNWIQVIKYLKVSAHKIFLISKFCETFPDDFSNYSYVIIELKSKNPFL